MAKSKRPSRGARRGSSAHEQKRASTREQLEEEYSYVLRDLRQILILAVIMFGLLIVLNLIL